MARLSDHLRRVHPREATDDVIRRAAKAADRARASRHGGRTLRKEFPWWTVAAAGVMALLVVGLVWGYQQANPPPPDPNVPIEKSCIQRANIKFHHHVQLTILINGAQESIPANIGVVSAKCYRYIHTHEDTPGRLHIESPNERTFHLWEFFKVWKQPFSKDRILVHTADSGHAITMEVNGNPSAAYEQLVLVEGVEIVIRYGSG